MKPTPRQILDSAADSSLPDTLNLLPKILFAAQLRNKRPNRQPENRKTALQTLRAKPLQTILFTLLALTALSSAAYAIGRSLGYLPGVGLVENTAPVRVLREKISSEKDGLTLTVKTLVADSRQTVLEYRISGISFQPNTARQPCEEKPALRLPDGGLLTSASPSGAMGGENGSLTLEAKLIFPPLPPDAAEVTLLPPCGLPPLSLSLQAAAAGVIQPGTELPASFTASAPSLPTVLPATESKTSMPEIYPTNFPATPTPVANGSGLYLEKTVELENSYLLMGNFTNANDLPGAMPDAGSFIPYEFHLIDGGGKTLAFSIRPDLTPDSIWPNVTYWALEIQKPVGAPITISLPKVPIALENTFQFPLDSGANPAVGQIWPINQSVQVGAASFMVEGITHSERGYTMHLRTDSPLARDDFFVSLNLEEKTASLLSERLYERDGFLELSESLLFEDPPPAGRLTFTLTISVNQPLGPWSLTWSPPKQP